MHRYNRHIRRTLIALGIGALLWSHLAQAQDIPVTVGTYQRVQSYAAACVNRQLVVATSGVTQTQCDVGNLSIPVNLTGLSTVRITYNIYGNAHRDAHDGVNTYVTGPPSQPILAVGELVPLGIIPGGLTYGAAAVSVTEVIQTDESFVATVRAAWFHDSSSIKPEENWGGMSRKMGQPSELIVEVLPPETIVGQ